MYIGQIFRYGRPYSPTPEIRDDLVNYFHATYCTGSKLPLLESGINPIKMINAVDGPRRPAIIVSSSPHKIGSKETPWQDFFDPDHGHIRYYGDNKTSGVPPERAEGNKVLYSQFSLHNSFDAQERKVAVPLVFFERVKIGRRVKGNVKFQGFGVIEGIELVTQFDPETGKPFTNFSFDFTVLNLQNEGEIFDWTWINDRRNPSLSLEETLARSPKSWVKWIEDGPSSREKLRRRVSKLLTTKSVNQKPPKGTIEYETLFEIYNFYEDKSRFEYLASKVASRILGADSKYIEGWVTPSSNDGGSDFVGRLDLGSDFSTTKLIVLGQAKCENPNSVTSGKDIARTVARLKRGWKLCQSWG